MPGAAALRALTPVECSAYKQDGFVLVRGLFNAEEMASLREGFAELSEIVSGGELRAHYLRDHPPLPGQSGPSSHAPRVFVHVGKDAEADGDSLKHLRKVNWPAFVHPGFEKVRQSRKWAALLAPLLGEGGLRQFINQVNFKHPGGDVEFPWHQDIRDPHVVEPLKHYVQTYLLVDEATEENGALAVVPGSQLGGARPKPLGGDWTDGAVLVTGQPGDCLLFSTYTIHGSGPNRSGSQRRSYINGFMASAAAKDSYCVPAFGAEGEPLPLDTHGWDYSDLWSLRRAPRM